MLTTRLDSRRLLRLIAMCVATLTTSCGRSAPPPPQAGQQMGLIPDLRGVRVMLLPVQSARGVGNADPEPEIVFAMTGRSDEVLWITPNELRRIAQRTPGLDLGVDRLPVGVFLQTEVRRVGDPLYGHLRRLAAIANSDLAFVPIEVRYRPATTQKGGAMEIAATLIHARTGRVVWFGIVEGREAGPRDPSGVATAAERLARRIVLIAGENHQASFGDTEP